jgi:hypothetical protein
MILERAVVAQALAASKLVALGLVELQFMSQSVGLIV